MRQLFVLLISVTGFFFNSCHSTKSINKAIAPKDTSAITSHSAEDSILFIRKALGDIKEHHIDFNTFSAKVKVEFENSKGKRQDLNAVVRMIKDSAIWMSLSATVFNVEAFRVLITRDSLILLNKLEKEVQYRSHDYLQEVTGIPFDFKTLQDLIVGNPVFFNDSNALVKKLESFTLVSSAGIEFKNLLTLSSVDNLLLHSKLDDVDRNRNRTADLTYDDYSNSNGAYFSVKRQIIASEKNKIDIRLNFRQFEFNKQLSVGLSVPKNYLKK